MDTPFWREESDIKRLEIQIIEETDPLKKLQLEHLLNKHQKELAEKKEAANFSRRQLELQKSVNQVAAYSGSMVYFFIGLIFPYPIGLILWFIFLFTNKKNNARETGWGILTGTLLLILFIVCYITFGWSLFNCYTDTLNNQINQPIEQVTPVVDLSSAQFCAVMPYNLVPVVLS